MLSLTQFLIVLLKLEAERKSGFFASFWRGLCQNVVAKVCQVVQEDEDCEEELLDNLVDVLRGLNRLFVAQAYPSLLEHARANWDSASLAHRVSAVCALESLVESAPDEEMKAVVGSVLPALLKDLAGLHSPKLCFRLLALLHQVVEWKPFLLHSEASFASLFEALLPLLQPRPSGSVPLQMVTLATAVLNDLLHGLADTPRQIPGLGPALLKIAGFLVVSLEEHGTANSGSKLAVLYEALRTYCAVERDLSQTRAVFVRLSSFCQRVAESAHSTDKLEFCEELLIVMHLLLSCWLKDPGSLKAADLRQLLDFNEFLRTVDLVQSKLRAPSPHAMFLVTDLVLAFVEDPGQSVPLLMSKYVFPSLSQVADLRLYSTACNCLTKLLHAKPALSPSQSQQLLAHFLAVLSDPAADQRVKIATLAALSDMVLTGTLPVDQALLAQLFHFLFLALQAVGAWHLNADDDPDCLPLAKSMGHELNAALTTLMFVVFNSAPQLVEAFRGLFAKALAMVKELVGTVAVADPDFLAGALRLAMDYFLVNQEQVEFVDVDLVNHLISALKQFPGNAEAAEALEMAGSLNFKVN